jgi:hypothetical protein
MKPRNLVGLAQLALSVIFLVGTVSLGLKFSIPSNSKPEQTTGAEGGCLCGKVHADAGIAACSPPPAAGLSLPTMRIADDAEFRRVSVSSLVRRALEDQREMLEAKQVELRRWSPRDRATFAKWFGTTSPEARKLIHDRVLRVLELNKNYSVGNFRRANPPRPNVYAYVYAGEPNRIYVDNLFVGQIAAGENSRAGTITHEMSHFLIAGGTKDFVYGPEKCKTLARTRAAEAIMNADSFEYWAEGAR